MHPRPQDKLLVYKKTQGSFLHILNQLFFFYIFVIFDQFNPDFFQWAFNQFWHPPIKLHHR